MGPSQSGYMAELALSYPQTNPIGLGGDTNKLYRLAEKKDKKTTANDGSLPCASFMNHSRDYR